VVYSSNHFLKLYVTLGLVISCSLFLNVLFFQKPTDKPIEVVSKGELLIKTQTSSQIAVDYAKESNSQGLVSVKEKSNIPTQPSLDNLPKAQPSGLDQSEKKLEKNQIEQKQLDLKPISMVTTADLVEEPASLPGIKMEDPSPSTHLPNFKSDTWKMPFRSGVVIQMHQGYNGQFSHRGKYALDFPHADGIEILAARGGTVIQMASGGKWDGWCRSPKDCATKGQISAGNNITIQHSDGTKAKYYHFRPGTISSSLNVGSAVNQGTFLGLMGSTGYTCLTPACTEPDNHLHFEVQTNNGVTIPTPFMECVNRANVCDSNGWFVQYNYYTSD
jgi:murein DD-endopeptidase MepM/ murein hydrolase activator NlpD